MVARAADWPMTVDGDRVTVRVADDTTVVLTVTGGAVHAGTDARCGCLLAPNCLHRAAVLARCPVLDQEAGPVDQAAGPVDQAAGPVDQAAGSTDQAGFTDQAGSTDQAVVEAAVAVPATVPRSLRMAPPPTTSDGSNPGILHGPYPAGCPTRWQSRPPAHGWRLPPSALRPPDESFIC